MSESGLGREPAVWSTVDQPTMNITVIRELPKGFITPLPAPKEKYSAASTRELMQFLEEWYEECDPSEATSDELSAIDQTISLLRRVAAQREQSND